MLATGPSRVERVDSATYALVSIAGCNAAANAEPMYADANQCNISKFIPCSKFGWQCREQWHVCKRSKHTALLTGTTAKWPELRETDTRTVAAAPTPLSTFTVRYVGSLSSSSNDVDPYRAIRRFERLISPRVIPLWEIPLWELGRLKEVATGKWKPEHG